MVCVIAAQVLTTNQSKLFGLVFQRHNGSFVPLSPAGAAVISQHQFELTPIRAQCVCQQVSRAGYAVFICPCSRDSWFEFKSVPGVYVFSVLNTSSAYKPTLPNSKPAGETSRSLWFSFSLHRTFTHFQLQTCLPRRNSYRQKRDIFI